MEVANSAANVSSAGFIPGPGVAPSLTVINTIEDVVTWELLAPALQSGQSTNRLFICSPRAPGGVSDTVVGIGGPVALDAPGTCVGPIASVCEIEVDKTCCIPPPPTGGACDGKVTRMVFEYTGKPCATSNNPQAGKASCSGNLDGQQNVDITGVGKDGGKLVISPNSGVFIDDLVEFTSTDGQFKASTKFDILGATGDQSLTIHTSCSKPLSVCDQFGSMKLTLLETTGGGVTHCNGGGATESACEIPGDPEGTTCEGGVSEVVFEYKSQPCQTPLPNPQNGKATCSGNASGATDVTVTYTGKDSGKITASPSLVNDGDEVRLTATGTDKLKASTKLLLQNAWGDLQTLEIHTSCSKPLALGDEFGSLRVIEFTQKDGAVKALGDPTAQIFFDECTASEGDIVEYQYKVTNPNVGALENISVDDVPLGHIGDIPLLASGDMVTLFQQTTILTSTMNTVTVTGDSMTQVCEPAQDSVWVKVDSVPPVPFTCSKPIDGLTMIWNGTETVRVRVYKGNVGSTLLLDLDGVTPGSEVTVSGYAGSPNDVFWEIFAAGTLTKLGESTFHLSCSDQDMNDPSDCGKPQGDGKGGKASTKSAPLLNDWLLEGIVGATSTLDCSGP